MTMRHAVHTRIGHLIDRLGRGFVFTLHEGEHVVRYHVTFVRVRSTVRRPSMPVQRSPHPMNLPEPWQVVDGTRVPLNGAES